jgi:hypothetical protein
MCVTIHLQFNCNSFTIQKTRIFDKKRQRKKKKKPTQKNKEEKKKRVPLLLVSKEISARV